MAGDSRSTDPSNSAPEPEGSDAVHETGAESALPDHPRRAGRAAHAAAERARAAAESIHQAISPDPVDEVGTEWLEAALADTAAITVPDAAATPVAPEAEPEPEAVTDAAATPVAPEAEPEPEAVTDASATPAAPEAEPEPEPEAVTDADDLPTAQLPVATTDASDGADLPTQVLNLPTSAPAPADAPTEAISLEQLGELGRESDAAATTARAASVTGAEPLSLAEIVAAVAAAQAAADTAIETPVADGAPGSEPAREPELDAPAAAPESPALAAEPVTPVAEPTTPAAELPTPNAEPTTPAAEPAAPDADTTGHPADPRVALTLPPELRRELLTPIAEPVAETIDPDSEEGLARAAAGHTPLPPELSLGRDSVPETATTDDTRLIPLSDAAGDIPAADALGDLPEVAADTEGTPASAVSADTVALDTAAFHAAASEERPEPVSPATPTPAPDVALSAPVAALPEPVAASAEPAADEPEPAADEPVVDKPEPVIAEPGVAEPAPVVVEPEPDVALSAPIIAGSEPEADALAAAQSETQAFDTAAFHRRAAELEAADRAPLVFTDPTPSAAIDLPTLPAMAAAGSLSDTAAIDLARDAARPDSGDSGGPTDPPSARGIAGWSFGKRLGLAFVAGAVIALVLIGTQIPRLFGIGEVAEPAATVTATPAPAAAQKVAWNKLTAGACLTDFKFAWDETFTVVDCGDDHVAQLVFVAPIGDDPDAAFPGEEELAARSALVCSAPDAYSRPAANGLSTLQIQASYPVTQQQWDDGQRSYSCFASLSDGGTIPGSLVFGTE